MSQTRRRGNQILQDEIDSAIALVKTHNTNITRKLEKVKDMVSRYCENKGTAPAPAPSAPSAPAPSAPSAPSAPVSQFSAPTPTVLSTIPETNESNSNNTNVNRFAQSLPVAPLGASASVPVSLKSKGPKPWTNFRTMVGKDTQLKVGQTETSKKIATLWEQAKKGSSTNQIAQYLKNQLQVAPSLANKKAPELAKLAINYAKPTLSKRVTRTVRTGPAVNKTRNVPINPNTETDDEFWARMGKQANANAANKNARAMQQAENRRISRGEAALRATPALTPGKSRQVPLAANANVNRSSPIPTLMRNTTVVNPTTGKEEELSL